MAFRQARCVQAVKRNQDRFPAGFVFQLTEQEVKVLRSRIVILDEPEGAPQGRSTELHRRKGCFCREIVTYVICRTSSGAYGPYTP